MSELLRIAELVRSMTSGTYDDTGEEVFEIPVHEYRELLKLVERISADAAMFAWLAQHPNLYTVTDLLRADQYVTLRRACEALMPFDSEAG